MILQNIAIIAAIAVPALVLVLLRSNAAIAFFSLCTGSVLVRFVGHEANLAGTMFANTKAVDPYMQVMLLLLPLVLVAIITRKMVPASKLILNIIPAVAVGLVGVLLAVPLLSGGAHSAITETQGWKILEASQEFVVAVSVAASILVLWLTKPSHGKKKH